MTSWGHWSPSVWLVLDALATYRLIRLAQRDTVTNRPRLWLHDLGKGTKGRPFTGKLAPVANPAYRFAEALSGCPWCLSIWIGAGVTLATYFVPFVWSWVVTLLVFSAVAGWLSDWER